VETPGDQDMYVQLSVKLNNVYVGKAEYREIDLPGNQNIRLAVCETHIVPNSDSASLIFEMTTMEGYDQCDLKGICVELIAPCTSGYEYKYING
jgi:hypothetical protein